MKHLIYLLTLITLIPAALLGSTVEDPISERLVTLLAQAHFTASDVTELEKLKATGGLNECISTALLYRADAAQYTEPLISYFKIEKSAPTRELDAEAINQTVNNLLKHYQGRHPVEVSARLYLSFRKSNQVFASPDGPIYLEMMFRAAVFTGTLKLNESELIELSSKIDHSN